MHTAVCKQSGDVHWTPGEVPAVGGIWEFMVPHFKYGAVLLVTTLCIEHSEQLRAACCAKIEYNASAQGVLRCAALWHRHCSGQASVKRPGIRGWHALVSDRSANCLIPAFNRQERTAPLSGRPADGCTFTNAFQMAAPCKTTCW